MEPTERASQTADNAENRAAGKNRSAGTEPSLVVGVGASAGGLEAFKALLAVLPKDSGMAFILVQHLHPEHPSLLTELLTAVTEIAVIEAVQEQELRANTIYVIPPGRALVVRGGMLGLEEPKLQRGVRLPVDRLFQSMAVEWGDRAVGVVLSGAGSDGSQGVRALRVAGALTLAQEPSSSIQSGMPVSAIRTGAIDQVLPIEHIPLALREYQRSARRRPVSFSPAAPSVQGKSTVLTDAFFAQLTVVLESRAEFALHAYKRGTVERRVLRRMGVSGITDPEAYLSYVRENQSEQHALVSDLLICVTDFLRDPEAFESLNELVVTPLVERARAGETLRIWVPGCATGEEAYSIAMSVLVAVAQGDKTLRLQVFATDIDSEALTSARAGVYPTSALAAVPDDWVERFFEPIDQQRVQVRRILRESVSFAMHDLTQDPPFSRMHLVSCRNVLIYLRSSAQEQVLALLHFALHPEGFLFLGFPETVGALQDKFVTVSKKFRIYCKQGTSRLLNLPTGAARSGDRITPLPSYDYGSAERISRRPGMPALSERARRFVLRNQVPPTLVVDEAGSVVFMHGELRPFLRFPDGEPRLVLSALLNPDLASRVQGLVRECRTELAVVVAWSTRPRSDVLRPDRVKITAVPAMELGPGTVMVTFEESVENAREDGAQAESEGQGLAERAIDHQVVEQLEQELAATRADLRTAVEDLESSNEELRNHNEEAISLNEELQSTNEELEATSEELRSLNEELTTVNTQLREKVELLEQTNDDLSNFFSSTKIATVFLDEGLRIKRFTPAAQQLLNLDSTDLGRAIGDIARDLLQHGLTDEAANVLEHFAGQSRDIQTQDGRWITRQVLPYRTEQRRVEGVVVTLVDVSEHKATMMRLGVQERQQAVVARLGIRALEQTDLQTFLEQVVREVQETLQTDFCKLLELQPGGELLLLRAGVGWQADVVSGTTVTTSLDSQAGYTVRMKEPVVVSDLSTERRFVTPTMLHEHEVVSGMSCVIGSGQQPYGVLGVHTRTQRDFGHEETNFLQSVATVVAGAIDHHEATVRLMLEGAAAKAVADAKSLREVLVRIHETVVESLGEGIAELWEFQQARGHLTRVALHASEGYSATDLEAQFGPGHFAPGEGMVGRVFARRTAEWLTACQDPENFPRVAKARGLGLTSGLALPVQRGERVLGVLILFFSERVHADEEFLRSLEGVGRSLGDLHHGLQMEQRWLSTVERAPVGIADRSLAGRFLRVNERLSAITGYSQAELQELQPETLLHIDDVPAEQGLLIALQNGTVERKQLEQRYIRRDGSVVWVSTTTSVVCNSYGEVEYCVSVVEDISSRKVIEDELRDSEARFRQVLLSSPVPMVVFNEAGKVLNISDSWTQVLGYTLEQIPTVMHWMRQAYPDRVEEMSQVGQDSWDNPELYTREFEAEVRTASGERRNIKFNSTMLGRSREGQRLRLTAAADITQQRRFERELLEANRQKDEFLAMLGHELRNPLAAVRSAAELLKESADDGELRERLQLILERQTQHMAKLLDGLLDVSRVVRGKIELDRKALDLRSVIGDVLDNVEAAPAAEGIMLQADLGTEPVWVDGDAVRLTQVVDNVLSNAVKYTPAPGQIRLTLRTQEGAALVRVVDTGVGIEPELLPHLFEPFRQGKQSLDRSRGGLGIGLSLVKQLVELHGGTVQASSAGIGQGAEFLIQVPLCGGKTVEVADAPAAEVPREIVVIEDNEDAAEMLRSSLTRHGHRVTVAHRGGEGVALTKELQPDVVICDLGLPDGLSGFQVAETLRQDPETRHILLLAVSGYGRAADKMRSQEAGFDGHLTKPVSMQDLQSNLLQVRNRPQVR